MRWRYETCRHAGGCASRPSSERRGERARRAVLGPGVAQCLARLDSDVTAGQLRSDVPTDAMAELFYAPTRYRRFSGFGDAAVGHSRRSRADPVRHALSGLRPGRRGGARAVLARAWITRTEVPGRPTHGPPT
ncbi:hypothetical protein [Streptomyces sp. NPDC088726]|uniref:hypothetical protein n=1 Tax=Streptomyces sp. NPDC088726 TaxID=3365874 RepID=UPI0037FFA076